jgi:hypothetical protein
MRITFYQGASIEIDVFETDTDADLRARIVVATDTPPEYIIYPADVDLYHSPRLTNILQIMPEESTEAVNLYKSLKVVPLLTFVEAWVMKPLWSKASPINTLDVDRIKRELTFAFKPRFKGDARHDIDKYINDATAPVLESKRAALRAAIDEARVINEESIAVGEGFATIEGYALEGEEAVGHIAKFSVRTKASTGWLFDHIDVSPEMPVARYKGFFKMHTAPTVEKMDVTTENEIATNAYSDLRVYSAGGEIVLHARNTAEGLDIQCLIEPDAFLGTTVRVMEFLKLSGEAVHDSHNVGIQSQFYIRSEVDASVFSDMIMNDPLFKKFLSVNDTVKINRDKGKIYCYFRDSHIKRDLTESDIMVGGGSKAFSRFGDVTAILNNTLVDGEMRLKIRVKRSTDDTITASFKHKIGRLVRYYKDNEADYTELYHTLLGTVTAVATTVVGVEEKDSADVLVEAEPRIFPIRVYKTKCQRYRPVIITEEEAAPLPEDRKVLFPPLPYQGIQPRWYTCPDGKKPYPGLQKTNMADHPFGYFPCCYIKPWTDDNRVANENTQRLIMGEEAAAVDETTTSSSFFIETDKMIFNLEQTGVLHPDIESFFLSMEPTQKYVRAGIPMMDSLLLCMEYQHSMINKVEMRTREEIRRLLLTSIDLSIGLQQNPDIGTEGMRALLEDTTVPLTTRFTRILENFYDKKICIFQKDKTGIRIFTPNYIHSYYQYDNAAENKRPIVAIYQHQGGRINKMDIKHPHHELIIAQRFSNARSYNFNPDKASWRRLFVNCFRYYDLNRLVSTPTQFYDDKLSLFIQAQYVDVYGKCRVYLFGEDGEDDVLMGILVTPAAPLRLPVRSDFRLHSYDKVSSFLEGAEAQIEKVVRWSGRVFFAVRMADIRLYFPCEPPPPAVTVATIAVAAIEEDVIAFLSNLDKQGIFGDLQQKIRIAKIIEYYCLWGFSWFLDNNKELLGDRLVEEWIDVFLDEETVIVDDAWTYPEVSDIPVMFTRSVKNLVEDGKVLVAEAVRNKLRYYLRWFFIRRHTQLLGLKDQREIPNYYQTPSDFQQRDDQIILNTYQAMRTEPHVYATSLDVHQPLNIPFYYFHMGVLRLACRTDRKEKAAGIARAWREKGVFDKDARGDDGDDDDQTVTAVGTSYFAVMDL